jgi:hypothetical protein
VRREAREARVRDLCNHLAFIACHVVLRLGAVERDNDGATDRHHEGRVPEDPGAAGDGTLWQASRISVMVASTVIAVTD